MPNHRRTAALLACLALLGACGRQTPPPPAAAPAATARPASGEPPAAAAHLPPGIDWFAGDVDAAFAAARQASKPLFLFWGAEWCPPCAQVKATIFSRREFQERSRLFVPVYLDGDAPGAQRLGERFGIVGYPTMILFRADGTEITRLPGGVDVARYATILDAALADARPAAELLALADTGSLAHADWRLLAYYSWATDNGRALPAERSVATFRRLAERCPADLPGECARLFFEYLAAAAREQAAGRSPLDGLQRAEARRRLGEVLRRPAAMRDSVEHLLFGAEADIGLLSDAGTPERAALVRDWTAALDGLAAAPGALSGPEQLNLLRARVLLARLAAPDAPLPAELLAAASRESAAVVAATRDPYARHAATNAAANLLLEAGLNEDAHRLLADALETSHSPYYFMLELADLAKKSGRETEALGWLERAWRESRGPATRFQWGYNYLVGLVEMAPGDTTAIRDTGLAVLGELASTPDAFHQRTTQRMDRLSGLLLEWGREGAPREVVAALRAQHAKSCASLRADDPGRASCERFLAPPAAAASAG